MNIHGFCLFVLPINPMICPATHIVVLQFSRLISDLTRTEFLQIIRRSHSGYVEKIFVLTDARCTFFGTFAFWCKTVNGYFGFVYRNWFDDTDLRRKLIHKEYIWIN